MQYYQFNIGVFLIAASPVIVGHIIFLNQKRYILLSWFSCFVFTVLSNIAACFYYATKDKILLLLAVLPFDSIGKVLLKCALFRFEFLKTPCDRASLGLCIGLGFSLGRVLIFFAQEVVTLSKNIYVTDRHSIYFPDAADLAISYHASSLFQMGISLLMVRFGGASILHLVILFFVLYAVQFAYSAISLIKIIALKLVLLLVLGYCTFAGGLYSYKSLDYGQL